MGSVTIKGLTARSVGADPAGSAAAAEQRAKNYADEKLTQVTQASVTLASLGGEQAGAAEIAIALHTSHPDPHPQYIQDVERGQPRGVASLGDDGKVFLSQLPPLESPGAAAAVEIRCNQAAIASAQTQVIAHEAKDNPHPQYAEDRDVASLTERVIGHEVNYLNPHQVTAGQIGAEPVGAETRSKAYTDQKITAIPLPTPAQIGAIATSARSANNGVAALDSAGKIPGTQQILMRTAQLWPVQATRVSGANPIPATNAWLRFGLGYVQFPAAVNDEISFSFLVSSGNYRLVIFTDKAFNRGIVSVFIGTSTSAIGSFDCYDPGGGSYHEAAINFTLAGSGLQTIRFRVAAKNNASSDFYFQLSAAFIHPQ